jgi:hypothetical protein
MKAYESSDPQGQAAQMLTLLWDGFCEPVWTYRNNKLYHAENNTMATMMRTLGDRLQWFQDNKEIVLAPRHYICSLNTVWMMFNDGIDGHVECNY